jgi:Tfp pilus assembly protein PilO
MIGTSSISERQQIVGIILAAALFIGLLWFFALLPLQHKREALEQENRRMQEDLAKGNYLLGEMPLANRKVAVLDEGKRLADEWKESAQRLSTFERQSIQGTQDVSKIDFKVALFEVRQSLSKKAQERGIKPNFDLAIDELVLSNEDARKRMLQLRAVEKLMDAAIEIKVGRVESVEPLEPISHRDEQTGELFLEEYPVRIQYSGTIENVYAFIHKVFQPGSVFAYRRLKIEKESLQNPDRVRADATLSALVFLRSIEEMKAPAAKAETITRPMGF